MQNPAERAACGNKANTTCLLQRIALQKSANKYKNHPCTTDAAAQVDLSILMNTNKTKCRRQTESRTTNSVWLATMVKNDAQTLVEWLVWHFLIGVNHVLVYDNESTDNIKVALAPFIAEGLVELIYFPGKGVQAKAYTDALAKAKKDGIVWLAALDVDEYIAPIADRCLHDFLNKFVDQKNTGGIRLNWQYVNSMGKLWRWDNGILDQTVLDRTGFYTGRSDSHVKTIARVARTYKFMDAHYALHPTGINSISPDNGKKGTYHFTNPPQTKQAVMIHTHVRTLEEWIFKRLRGRGSVRSNQCPYCNSTLEILTSEWLCLNGGGYGIPDKDGKKKCGDKNKMPLLNQAPNNWARPLNRGLSGVMKRISALMHAVLKMPIETIYEDTDK
eukprot:gene2170-4221_t